MKINRMYLPFLIKLISLDKCNSDAKNAAFIYSVAKKTVTNALYDGGCGKWVSKPQEGSSFFLDDGGDLDDASNRDGSAC